MSQGDGVAGSLEDLARQVAVVERIASEAIGDVALDPDTPGRLFDLLASISTLKNRAEAERLQELGVVLWNTALVLEGRTARDVPSSQPQHSHKLFVKLRHIAVDCMNIGSSCLGGLSSKYDIDQQTLLKFYSACGTKYLHDVRDTDSAELCFAKASDFVDQVGTQSPSPTPSWSKSMFDLNVGLAECAWERHKVDLAFSFIRKAKEFVSTTPMDSEYLASLQFNFGLYLFQNSELEPAVEWLLAAYKTRAELQSGDFPDPSCQGSTCRLLGLVFIDMRRFPDAEKFLSLSDQIAPDSRTKYLMLKLILMTEPQGRTQIDSRLMDLVEDPVVPLDILLSSLDLLLEAGQESIALEGCVMLASRFSDDLSANLQLWQIKCRAQLSLDQIDEASCTIRTSIAEIISSRTLGPKQKDDYSKCWMMLGLDIAVRSATIQKFDHAVSLGSLICNLRLTREPSPSPGVTTPAGCVIRDSEIPIRMLVATSALAQLAKLSKESKERKTHFINIALEYTARILQLKPVHVEATVLRFRALIISGQHVQASKLLHDEFQKEKQGQVVDTWVPLISSAILDAREAKNDEAIVSCLEVLVSCSADNIPLEYGDGFLGCALSMNILTSFTVTSFSELCLFFCSILYVETARQTLVSVVSLLTSPDETPVDIQRVLRMMNHGKSLLERHGPRAVLGPDKTTWTKMCRLLSDTAWNQGKVAGDLEQHVLCSEFFNLARYFMRHQDRDIDVLRNEKVACLLEATALIDSPLPTTEIYRRALSVIKEARQIVLALSQLRQTLENDGESHDNQNDSSVPLLHILSVRALSRLENEGELEDEVKSIIRCPSTGPKLLSQLGSILIETENVSAKAKLLDSVYSRLAQLYRSQLSEKSGSEDETELVTKSAQCLRNWLQLLLATGAAKDCCEPISRAVALQKDYARLYPPCEVRWLTSKTWETSRLLHGQGLILEAGKWATFCRQMCVQSGLSCGLQDAIGSVERFLGHCGQDGSL